MNLDPRLMHDGSERDKLAEQIACGMTKTKDLDGKFFWRLLTLEQTILVSRAVADYLMAEVPIDMVLHCPSCGEQHIDAVEDLPMPMPGSMFEGSAGWTNPPHRSHLCHGCGHIWRPADVPTNGVAAVKTKGKADSPIAVPAVGEPSDEQIIATGKANNLSWALCNKHDQRNFVDAVRAILALRPNSETGKNAARYTYTVVGWLKGYELTTEKRSDESGWEPVYVRAAIASTRGTSHGRSS